MHKEFENTILDINEKGIATLTLNRPKALNALSGEINRDILAAINEVEAAEEARVLIITGSARAFAAGADIKEMQHADPRSARSICQLAKNINEKLESMPIPTIAAVAGFAFGGGFELALSCDYRVGGPRTTVSFPEVGLGIVPGANGMIRACHIVGPSKAKELCMLTPMVSGKEASDLGLLNWFCEGDAELNAAAKEAKKAFGADKENADLKKAMKDTEAAAAQSEFDAIYNKALSVAEKLCTKPAKALESVKKVIYECANRSGQEAKVMESMEFALLFNTHDQKEGMDAFAEGRPAVYTNN